MIVSWAGPLGGMCKMWQDLSVRYVNHEGASFTLQGDGLTFLDVLPLYEYEWSYELVNDVSGMGGAAMGFSRFPRTLELELRMRGFTRAQFIQQMNDLHAVTDADALSGQPGRLYVGDQYMVCFLAVSATVESAPRLGNFATQTITVLAVRPFWCTEQQYTFNPAAAEEESPEDMGKKYNLRYPYRYGSGLAASVIKNTHYAPAPAIIVIYGPASNPSVQIGNVIYNVDVVLTASQRLVIDGTENRIYTVGSDGTETNVFNARNKAYDIFSPVPVGESPVLYSGDFLMTITLVQQRSQLKWTL